MARTALVEDLEARILFSADGFTVGVEETFANDIDSRFDLTVSSLLAAALQDDLQDDQLSAPLPMAVTVNTAPASTVELIVIDSKVENLEQLLDQIRVTPGVTFEFLILDKDSDGVEQITQTLPGIDNLDAIHIVSHGAAGVVELGNAALTAATIEAYKTQLGGWAESLNDGADIMFYGCDLASTDSGRALIDELSLICDSDVAASDNTTGHVSLGGDWDLEYQTGVIQSGLFLSDAGVNNWQATLDITTGLIGFWTFDNGRLHDLSVNDNHGVFLPSALHADGPTGFGLAAEFALDPTGNNRYLEIPDSSAFDFVRTEFTISFWYKSDGLVGSKDTFIDSTGASSSIKIFATGSDISFSISEGTTDAVVTAPNKYLDDGNWHHVLAVRESNALRLYTDTETYSYLGPSYPVVGQIFPGIDVNTDAPFQLGATSSNGDDFEGRLDDIRIYSRALDTTHLTELQTPNELPTFNSLLGLVETTMLNTEVEIPVANLYSNGNESDSDGTVVGFNVKSVLSGSLRIGSDVNSATPFSPFENDTIDAQNKAFWTPDLDDVGVITAFSVTVVDNDAGKSSNPIGAKIEVLDPTPTLTAFNNPVDGGVEDTEVEITFSELETAGDEQAPGGAVNRFVVENVESGSLKIGSSSGTSAAYQPGDVITAGTNAYWTPPLNRNGVIDAIAVTAMNSDGLKSASPVVASVSVAPVSDLPVGEDKYVSVTGAVGHIFSVSDFPFTDVDGDVLGAVIIDSLPANGQLQLDGALVGIGALISATDIDNDKLAYVPMSGVVAPAYDSFNFTVQDSGDASLNTGAVENLMTVKILDGVVGISSGIELNNDGGNNAYLISDGPIGFVADELTLEMQFSADYTAAEVDFLSYAQFDWESNELLWRLESGTNDLNIWIGNQTYITSSAIDYRAALLDGTRHAIAFTYDSVSGNWASYIDGVVVDQGINLNGAIAGLDSGRLVLGQEQDSIGGGFNPTEIFSGTLYDVRIWDHALQPDEIFLHHSMKFDSASLPSGLVANWQMDGLDDVVSGNNLTVGYAPVGNGFVSSEVRTDLHTDEKTANSSPSAHVGYVLPVEIASGYNLVQDSEFTGHGLGRGTDKNWHSGSLGAWDIVMGNIDIYSGESLSFSPKNGDVIDLSGNTAGAISQTINTVPGVEYQLVFALSGNGYGGDTTKTVKVSAGAVIHEMDYRVDSTNWSASNLIWSHEGFSFVATSSTTELRFESLENNDAGPLIADVEVRESPHGVGKVLDANPGTTYDPATGKFYKPVYDDVDHPTADVAASSALLNGVAGRLIRVESQHEDRYVADLVADASNGFWTSGNDVAAGEGVWLWGSDSQFWQGGAVDSGGAAVNGVYSNWVSTEPNNAFGTEHHLEINTQGWNDITSTTDNHYIIEWDAQTVVGKYNYFFSDDAGGRFAIDIDTGEITVANASLLDFEVNEFHDVDVEVIDEIGFSYIETLRIDVNNINEPPQGIDKAIQIVEDTTYTFLPADFSFTDEESDTLSSVIVDSLPGTGTLKLGLSAVAAGDSIPASQLSSLSYTPQLNNSGVDTFDFRVVDSGGTDKSGVDTDVTANTITFNILPNNDAPEGIGSTITIDEGTTHTFSAVDFGFTDEENHQLLSVFIDFIPSKSQLLLGTTQVVAGDEIPVASIANLVFIPPADGSGTYYDGLSFRVRDDGGTLNGGEDIDAAANIIVFDITNINDAPEGQNNTVATNEDTAYFFEPADFPFTDIENNALMSIVVRDLPANGQLNLNSTPVSLGQEITQVQLTSLNYVPDPDASGLQLGSFSFQIRDDGGTANSGLDTDPLWRAMFIDVLSVNDPPTGADKIVTTLEDTPLSFVAGDFGFNDTDGNTFQSVVIDSLPFNGQLEFNGAPVFAGQIINSNQLNLLRFIPEPDVNRTGYDTFSFSVQDDGGTAHGGADTDLISNKINIDVTSVNDAPQSADNTVSAIEDTSFVFDAADFVFTDLDNNNFTSIFVESLPVNGQLTFAGAPVTTGQEIPAGSISSLRFIAQPDESGQAYSVFHFSVRDDGGVNNGGADRSGSHQITIDVANINDAPSGVNTSVNTREDTPYDFDASDFGFTDLESDALLTVTISTLPSIGQLLLSGVPVTAGQVVQASSLSTLQFLPQANTHGTGYDSFTFVVQDDGGVAAGGLDTDPLPNTVTIDVSSVNDAPIGADNTLKTIEDTPLIFGATDFGFSDVADTDQFQSIVIDSLPLSGQLLLLSSPVVVGQTIASASLSDLVYEPLADASGTAIAEFDFRVQDSGGVLNGGVDTDLLANKITIDVESSNDSPVGADNTVTTDEDTPYQFSAEDFGFSDTDGNNLLSVNITSLPGVGQLLLSGVPVTVGQAIDESLLVDLTFVPQAQMSGLAYDSFSFKVQDDGGLLNNGSDTDLTENTITVDVLSVNDAPTGTDKIVSTLEDTPYVFDLADFVFNDIENNNLQNIIITGLPVNGGLTLAGVPIQAGQSVSAGAIGTMAFTPEPNASRTGYDSFSFVVQDDGGTANGGVDSDLIENKININVISVNDAPTGSDKTLTINEDTDYIFSLVDFGYSDVDADNFKSVVIETLPVNGQLVLAGAPVNAGQPIDAISDLKFTPSPNAQGSGYASFTFRVQDDGGTTNGGVDTDQVADTITIDVSSVNDAPTGADKTINLLEDVPYSFTATDFGFSDTDNHSLLNVEIEVLPANGQLRLAGSAVSAGQSIPAAALSDLVFTPEPNEFGSAYGSIQFVVQDDGGIAFGGLDTAVLSNSITFNVLSVNDAPNGSDTIVDAFEDTSYQFSVSDFGITDTENHSLMSVIITTLPVNGTLSHAGVPVVAGQEVSVSALTDLVFMPQPGVNQAAYDSFNFKIRDDGGNANNGVDIDPVVRKVTINVSSVNDAPSASNISANTLEDTPYLFSASDFGFSDSDNNNLSAVITDSLPANGLLSLAGAPVAVGQTISAVDISNLTYTPNANANGNDFDEFNFYVVDDGGTSSGGQDTSLQFNTWSIDVIGVNDAPLASGSTVNAIEDSAYIFTLQDFGFGDVDANNFEELEIQSLPGKGVLSFMGVPVSVGQIVASNDIEDILYLPQTDGVGVGFDSFEFTVRDDGGVSNGGIDRSVVAGIINIDVSPVNDAPVGIDSQVLTPEDTSYVFGAQDFEFSDTEGYDLQSVVITSVPQEGELLYDSVAVSVGQSIDVSMLSGLTYTPPANMNGPAYASFTFQVQDTGGNAQGGLDTSTTNSTMTIDVVEVNDAPVSIDSQVLALEDTPYVFNASDFNYSDTENDNLQSVVITSLPQAGELSFNSVAVSVGQSVDALQLSGLTYTPPANMNGPAYASFTFQVQDTGGNAQGGQDTSTANSTMIIDVAEVNDAPVATDSQVSGFEDTPLQFSESDFNFIDTENNTLAAIVVSSLPSNGVLYLAGVPVTLNQSISVSDIGFMEYIPEAHSNDLWINAQAFDSFEFLIIDSGGVVNGGLDTSDVVSRMYINIASVNDAPAGADVVITLFEDTVYTLMPENFGFSDVLDDNQLEAVRIDGLPSRGQLTIAGDDVFVGQLIPYTSLVAGELQFSPENNASGLVYDEFTFSVIDDGGVVNGGLNTDPEPNKISINVLAISDPPESSDVTIQVVEDTDYLFAPTEFQFNDFYDLDILDGLLIDSLPDSGSLQLAGNDIAIGQVVSAIDILNGEFVYKPDANAAGSQLTSFTFRVKDTGTNSNGGINLSVASNTVFIDVLEVNDAPQGSSFSLSVAEGEAVVIDINDFGYSDSVDNNQLSAVLFTEVPQSGVLNLGTVPVEVGQLVSVTDISSGLLVYSAPEDIQAGSVYGRAGFKVVDDGGVVLGGENTDVQERFIDFDLTGVNDMPSLNVTSLTVDEGSTTLLDSDLITAADVDDGPENLTLAIQRPPDNGVLLLNGEPLLAGGAFSVEQFINGEVVYTHDGSETESDSFLISLADGGEDGAQPVVAEIKLTIREVIDLLPELTDDNLQLGYGQAGGAEELSDGSLSVLDNDMLVSIDDYVITLETKPEFGSVTINDDGTFNYVHNGSQIYQDSFTYRVTNSDGQFQIAKVSVTIEPAFSAAVEFPSTPVATAKPETEAETESEAEEESAEIAQSNETQEQVDEVDLDFGMPHTNTDVDRDSHVDSVVFFEEEILSVGISQILERIDESVAVKKHNRNETISFDYTGVSSRSNIFLDLEVGVNDEFRDVTDNNYFRDALGRIDDEMNQANSDRFARYELGSETVMGVSISATAGVLAWALRGGALFASVMAATPLWSSIDPVNLMSGKGRGKDETLDSVERVFE